MYLAVCIWKASIVYIHHINSKAYAFQRFGSSLYLQKKIFTNHIYISYINYSTTISICFRMHLFLQKNMLISLCFPTILSSKLYTLIIITLTEVMSNNCVLDGKSMTVLKDSFIFKLLLSPSSLRRQFLFVFCTCITGIYMHLYIHIYIYQGEASGERFSDHGVHAFTESTQAHNR